MYVKTYRVIVLFLIVAAMKSAAADRPNILFIFTDDLNYKTLSCYPESPDLGKYPSHR